MVFIHDKADWPKFTWDAATITSLLGTVRHKQGRLLGKMESLGFPLRSEASLTILTSDIVNSSAIEGEILNPQEVRSSIARRLGLDVAGLPVPGRNVDGVVEMMLDATQRFEQSLTGERLFGWHAALFPTGRSGIFPIAVGAWRPESAGPMQVVSGPIGREKVHFEAPPAARLAREMDEFFSWFNGAASPDPVVKAAVAHLWFVTIHPFEDGNGRIARAIADMALARADGTKERFYSMSAQIEVERKAYYLALEAAQRGGLDITSWLEWFLACLNRSLDGAERSLTSVLNKANLWQRINHGKSGPVNDRQRMVINRLLDGFEGNLTTAKYAKLSKCSGDTALRDIREMLEAGLLVANAGRGRSTSYRLVDVEIPSP